MSDRKEVEVLEESNGQRLDKFLAEKLEISRGKVQNLIKENLVEIKSSNEKITNKLSVKTGDIICIEIPKEEELTLKPEDIPVDVVYEDEDVIVVNKPQGMVVHIGAGNTSGTLVNALLHHTKGKLASDGGNTRPGIVHRIDKDTSGLLVVAKTNEAYLSLTKQFSDHSIDREYKSLVWGIPNPIEGRVETNINRDRIKRQQMTVCGKDVGKKAITNYETMGVFQNQDLPPISLMKFKLETGRTHQIRVHMQFKKNPLIGDPVYKGKKSNIITVKNKEVQDYLKALDGQMLHAYKLEFTHPTTGKRMKFKAPTPDHMQDLIDFLDEFSL
ncbi:MAG: RluA family pseudouridine synthase [Alphaproteobacteria bacterium]|nr:RluA family pseudouridine synthase [Alphaproteobacteria bacterium]